MGVLLESFSREKINLMRYPRSEQKDRSGEKEGRQQQRLLHQTPTLTGNLFITQRSRLPCGNHDHRGGWTETSFPGSSGSGAKQLAVVEM